MTPPPTIPTMTRHKNTKKVYLKGRLFRLHKCAEHVLSNKYFVCTFNMFLPYKRSKDFAIKPQING